MHKSNYDKASEVAMGKLRPKRDISITISMKGGGGLSSLGDFPIIKRVSGGDVVDGDFFGGYTDEDALGPEFDDVSGTMSLAGKTVPVGYNPAAGRVTTGMLSGGSRNINYPDIPADADDFNYVENEKWRANILAGGGVGTGEDARGNYYTKVIGPDGQPRTMFHGYDRGPIDPNTLLGYQGQELKTFMPDLYGPMFNTAVGRDTAGMLAAGQTPTPDKFEDNEEYQLMGQPLETQDLIKDTKNYIDQLEEISKESFTSSWGRAKDIATNPQAASNFLSAALDPSKNNFYGKEALDIEPPDSLVEEANKARGIGQRKGGGGLSNIKRTMMINGQPHKLSYINPDEASLLKAIGGSGRKVNGIPAYDTNIDEWGDYDAGVDVSQGGAGAYGWDTGEGDAEITQAGPSSTTSTDALQDYDYFGEDGRFPTWGIPPEHRRDKLALVDPDRPAPLAYADTDDNINYRLSQEVPLTSMEKGLRSIAQSFGVKAPFGLPAKGDTKLVSEEEYEQMYGNRSGFAAKLDNRANQWLTGINKVRANIDRLSEEEDPKTPEEIEKLEREGLLEVAEKTFDKGSFRANEGQGVPGIGASYAMAAFNRAMGLLGTAEIDGIPVHVHEDGSVTPVSPEDEPGFDFSKMNITSDKEALPTRKQYRPTTLKTTTEDIVEEEKTTPIEGEKRLASLGGLQDIFRQSYGRPFRTI